MSEKFGKFLKNVFYGLFALVFVFVTFQLFFHDEMMSFKDLFSRRDMQIGHLEFLKIIYPDEPDSLEPTVAGPATRQRLVNIYEPLVKTDRDLNIQPALALNWGLIDDYTWEFELRNDVRFHDGSDFDADDVLASIKRARDYAGSELKGVLATVDEVEVLDSKKIRIKTIQPDPLLLQRMAQVLIIPDNYDKKNVVGTGPYKFSSWEKGNEMVFEQNDDYWGETPKFIGVTIYAKVDKYDRVNSFLQNEAHLLAFVPYDAVTVLGEYGFEVTTIPNLEVQFLLFNMESEFMKDFENRKIISLIIDQDYMVESVGGFAEKVTQFVSSGIFGFNPYISEHVYDMDQAEKLAEETGLKDQTLQLHLPKGLTVLGDYVRKQLLEIGVNVIVSYLEGADFVKSLEDGSADIYFLGFKSGDGDASEFLHSIAYSDGAFNYGKYENEYVDRLVESSLVEMDTAGRRKNLQDAMKIVTEDDIMGVPLFEYETVYGFVDSLDVEPRIDGMIYFDELTVK